MRRIFWTIPKEINNFQDANRIHDKECDEPVFLSGAGGVPQGVTFQYDYPKDDNDDEWQDKRE